MPWNTDTHINSRKIHFAFHEIKTKKIVEFVDTLELQTNDVKKSLEFQEFLIEIKICSMLCRSSLCCKRNEPNKIHML